MVTSVMEGKRSQVTGRTHNTYLLKICKYYRWKKNKRQFHVAGTCVIYKEINDLKRREN